MGLISNIFGALFPGGSGSQGGGTGGTGGAGGTGGTATSTSNLSIVTGMGAIIAAILGSKDQPALNSEDVTKLAQNLFDFISKTLPEQLQLTKDIQPQLAELQRAIADNNMEFFVEKLQALAPELQDLENQLTSDQRRQALTDMQELGSGISQNFRNSNPGLSDALGSLTAEAGRIASGDSAQAIGAAPLNTQFDTVGPGGVGTSPGLNQGLTPTAPAGPAPSQDFTRFQPGLGGPVNVPNVNQPQTFFPGGNQPPATGGDQFGFTPGPEGGFAPGDPRNNLGLGGFANTAGTIGPQQSQQPTAGGPAEQAFAQFQRDNPDLVGTQVMDAFLAGPGREFFPGGKVADGQQGGVEHRFVSQKLHDQLKDEWAEQNNLTGETLTREQVLRRNLELNVSPPGGRLNTASGVIDASPVGGGLDRVGQVNFAEGESSSRQALSVGDSTEGLDKSSFIIPSQTRVIDGVVTRVGRGPGGSGSTAPNRNPIIRGPGGSTRRAQPGEFVPGQERGDFEHGQQGVGQQGLGQQGRFGGRQGQGQGGEFGPGNLSPIAFGLQGQGLQRLRQAGRLSPDELRQIREGVASSFNQRGLVGSNPEIFAQELAKERFGRQRLIEDLGIAGGIGQQVFGEVESGRNFGLGSRAADIGAFGASTQRGLGLGELELGQRGQELQGLGQDRSFLLNRAGLEGQFAQDPFRILGIQSPAFGQFGAAFGAGGAFPGTQGLLGDPFNPQGFSGAANNFNTQAGLFQGGQEGRFGLLGAGLRLFGGGLI